MIKNAAHSLLPALALCALLGCDKPGDNTGGAGPTETSKRYQGVGEPPKQTHEQNPATLPTQPAAAAPAAPAAAAPAEPNAPTEEPQLPGTTRTPASAFERDAGAGAGATNAPSRQTAPKRRKND